MSGIFTIFKQVSPETTRPFRIMETVITGDGLRTRVTNGAFKTQADAEQEIIAKQKMIERLA